MLHVDLLTFCGDDRHLEQYSRVRVRRYHPRRIVYNTHQGKRERSRACGVPRVLIVLTPQKIGSFGHMVM